MLSITHNMQTVSALENTCETQLHICPGSKINAFPNKKENIVKITHQNNPSLV